MCRIAGIVDFETPPTEEIITVMRDAQEHGGPDDSGIYMDADFPLAFGFRRLSILDLSEKGHQPMLDQTGKIVLIFNGEIYNFPEIKSELIRLGHAFRSTSDSEVIIHAYIQWGCGCFERFNGMFGLALLDKNANKLILARDHAGIKPLYYALLNNKLYFASEVRAFRIAVPNWPENKDWKKYFLMFGHLPEPVTTLDGVRQLMKGTYMEVQLPSLKSASHRYHTLYYNYTIDNKWEALEKVEKLLPEVVKRQLISDAPIGLFLSGGLDSSLLTVLASEIVPQNLHTVSIVFESELFSEKYFQDLLVKQINCRHGSSLVTEKDFQDSLPDILEAMDQPSNDGINSYFVSRYARSFGLKAVLSGLGADEIFGGYQSFNRTNWIRSIKGLPGFMFAVAGIVLDNKRRKLSFLNLNSGLGEYLFNRGFFIPREVAQLLDCTEKEVLDDLLKLNSQVPLFIEKLLPKERISYLESNLYMLNQLLKDMDCMSMWHGLEVRVPFLDKELMRLAYSINPDVRYDGQRSKYLLTDAFVGKLPGEIIHRPKRGFQLPFEQWMRNVRPVKGNSAAGSKLIERFQGGKVHWSKYWSYLLTKRSEIANWQ